MNVQVDTLCRREGVCARNVPEHNRTIEGGRHGGSRHTLVIIEEPTQALTTANPTLALRRRRVEPEARGGLNSGTLRALR